MTSQGGYYLEKLLGHGLFAVIYFIFGILGGLLSLSIYAPDVVSVGASGAIFGVFGAIVGVMLAQRGDWEVVLDARLGGAGAGTIAYNILYGLNNPQIDMAGHMADWSAALSVACSVHAGRTVCMRPAPPNQQPRPSPQSTTAAP